MLFVYPKLIRHSYKILLEKNQVENVVNRFRKQIGFTVREFDWYLYLKNIPPLYYT